MRMIDPLASSVKPIPKDRFSHAMAHFVLLVTLQNMIRYMILDILSGSTLYRDFIRNKHALIRKLWEAEKMRRSCTYIY